MLWILFGTRWISYVGFPPVFITDILVALALISWALNTVRARACPGGIWPSLLGTLTALFLAYTVVRLALSPLSTEIIALRDAAPYLYAILGMASASSARMASTETLERTVKGLRYALVGHLAWCAGSATGLLPGLPMWPGASNRAFEIRTDVDMALLGVTAALFLRRSIVGPGRTLNLFLMLASFGIGISLHSRAGLLGILGSVAIGLLLTLKVPPAPRSMAVLMLAIPAALLAIIVFLPATQAGQRMLATVGIIPGNSSAGAENAVGTASAREVAWDRVIQFIGAEWEREVIGVGFGANFLRDSGAEVLLSGTDYTDVRSPHNMFLGVYARLGLVGIGMLFLILACVIMSIIIHLRVLARDDLATIAITIIVALAVVSTLGVVLEAPFGAVPFWWSIGIIGGRAAFSGSRQFEV